MSVQEKRESLGDIQTFVDLVELKDVTVMGLSGALKTDSDGESETQFELSFAPAFKSAGLRTRFKIEFTNGKATFMADMAAHWEFPHAVSFKADTVIEFAERVAFMTVYPYLRESIASTAARMNQPIPTLGLIKADHFSLDVDPESLQALIDKTALLETEIDS
ncbi:hypothetical protein ABIB17_002018 [Arthrobacter sp. UYEF6]